MIQSPSPRRAWIEMFLVVGKVVKMERRPPHGGRGLKFRILCIYTNCMCRPPHGGRGLKYRLCAFKVSARRSPSPRRAWIEILLAASASHAVRSRPPHGGRGLKCCDTSGTDTRSRSPSPRRAWIEMYLVCSAPLLLVGSPSPRRAWIEIAV